MKKIIVIMFILLATSAYAQGNVNRVKSGVLNAYPNVVIEKALEATFDQPKWSERVTRNGTEQVLFTGKIKERMFKDCYGMDRATYKEYYKVLYPQEYITLMMMGIDPDELWDAILKPGEAVTVIFNAHTNKKTFSIADYVCDSCLDDIDLIDYIFNANNR